MNAKQEARLGMFNAVSTYCTANTAIIATIPAFQQAAAELASLVTAIRAAARAEIQVILGVTQDKTQKKKIVSTAAATIAAAVYASAATSGNMELKYKANFSFSALMRQKDLLLPATCRNIHATAAENLAALAPYGITQPRLDEFMAAILDYESAAPEPRNAVSNRSAQGAALVTLFRQASSLLSHRMDKLAMQFITTHPDFYLNYKNNRIIIDPRSLSAQPPGDDNSPG